MKPEERKKELGQAWHHNDPFDGPEGMIDMWSHWAFQGPFPKTTDGRVRMIGAALRGFAVEYEVKMTRAFIQALEEQAAEWQAKGLGVEAQGLMLFVKTILERGPLDQKPTVGVGTC